MRYSIKIATVMLLFPASVLAQARIFACQGDFQSVERIEVYNFTTAGVSATPPVPVPTNIPWQVIPVGPTRTPVPVEHQGKIGCVDNETTTFIDVPSMIDPPGAPRTLAAWAFSRWNTRSGRSNVLTGNALPFAKPVLVK